MDEQPLTAAELEKQGFPKPDHVYRFGDWSFMVVFRAGPVIKRAKVVTGEKDAAIALEPAGED